MIYHPLHRKSILKNTNINQISYMTGLRGYGCSAHPNTRYASN